MDHTVKGDTSAGDTPGALWGAEQKIRQIDIGVHKKHLNPATL